MIEVWRTVTAQHCPVTFIQQRKHILALFCGNGGSSIDRCHQIRCQRIEACLRLGKALDIDKDIAGEDNAVLTADKDNLTGSR